MKTRVFRASSRSVGRPFLAVCLWGLLIPAGATPQVAVTFENTDLQRVIKEIGQRTKTTFLFDPAQVKGKITLLVPHKVTPEQAIRLLGEALRMQGYAMRKKADRLWIVQPEVADPREPRIAVVPLQYARAEELADTLAAIAPAGLRIVPYRPTNSLLIAGEAQAVAELIKLLSPKEKE